MSAVAPAPETPAAETLVKLCRQKQWQAAIQHVRANPEDVKAVSVAGRGSLPPLHVACENGAPIQVIKVLLSSHPSAAQTKSGLHDRLPLHCLLAAALSYPLSDTVVSTLVEAYPGACRVADKQGNLPIHLACQATNVPDSIFTSILSMYPEGAYARNFAGSYPLHTAASNKDLKTKKTALAALDRGTLYAAISKMTSIRLSKEHEAKTQSLEKSQADKLSKMEAHSKEERSKLQTQIKSLQSQLKDETEGSQKLKEEMKALKVEHEENITLAVRNEQTKASDMERELRSELAEVQLKNMDFLEEVETAQAELDTSNEKVENQEKEIKALEENLEDVTKALGGTNEVLGLTSKELHETQDHLTSAQNTNEAKSKYILHLEASLQDARESILVLVKEQERMNANMTSQKVALAALLLGHDTTMNDAGALIERMVGLASDIEKATNKEGESEETDNVAMALVKSEEAVAKEDGVKEE